jgi:hypothetical protein
MENRKYNFEISELIDRLSILVIKSVKDSENQKVYFDVIGDVLSDVEGDFNNDVLTSKIIRLCISLVTINSFIYLMKEEMMIDEDKFTENTKKGHQLNGIRNKIKNEISKYFGEVEHKTNTNEEGILEGKSFF